MLYSLILVHYIYNLVSFYSIKDIFLIFIWSGYLSKSIRIVILILIPQYIPFYWNIFAPTYKNTISYCDAKQNRMKIKCILHFIWIPIGKILTSKYIIVRLVGYIAINYIYLIWLYWYLYIKPLILLTNF